MLREYALHVRLFSRNARLFLAGTFFFGFGQGALWLLLNLHLSELGFDGTWIGRILSARAVGTVLAALFVASVAARAPIRRFLIGAALCCATAYAGLAVGRTPAVLLPAAILAGAGFTVHLVVAAPFFMRNSTPRERLHLFGVSWAVEIAAGVLGTATCGWAARTLGDALGSPTPGYRITLLGAGAFLALSIIPYLLIRDASTRGSGPEPGPARRDWGLLARLVTPAFIVGFGAGLIVPFLNLYFRDRFARTPETIGAIFASGEILTTVGFLAGPVIARRIGMIRTVAAAEILSIPFFLVLAFSTSLPVAIGAFWLRGSLMNMNHPVSTNFAMEAVGEANHAFTNSVLMLAWNTSWMVSTQLGGALIERHGFTLPMLLTSGLYLISSFLYLGFFDRRERSLRARGALAGPGPGAGEGTTVPAESGP